MVTSCTIIPVESSVSVFEAMITLNTIKRGSFFVDSPMHIDMSTRYGVSSIGHFGYHIRWFLPRKKAKKKVGVLIVFLLLARISMFPIYNKETPDSASGFSFLIFIEIDV